MNQDTESFVSSAIERCWNAASFDDEVSLYDPDFRFVTHEGDRIDFCQYKRRIETVRTVFSPFEVTPVEFITEPSTAAVRVRLSGTHQEPFLGIDASGRSIAWASMFWFRLEDSAIREEQHFTNLLAVRKVLAGGCGE